MEITTSVSVQRLSEAMPAEAEDLVVRESALTIFLNETELVTLLCSPSDWRYLAAGFLFSEGLLQSRDDIQNIVVDEAHGVVRVNVAAAPEAQAVFKRFISSGCGRGAGFYAGQDVAARSKVDSALNITPSQVYGLMSLFQHRSDVFRATGGVHSAGLATGDEIVLFAEDIGRHNAVDKVFGQCLLEGVATQDRILLTSGRVSSEIVLKVARRSVPCLISRSAPTDLGVRMANELGITLIGFVRGHRMNVYSHPERLSYD